MTTQTSTIPLTTLPSRVPQSHNQALTTLRPATQRTQVTAITRTSPAPEAAQSPAPALTITTTTAPRTSRGSPFSKAVLAKAFSCTRLNTFVTIIALGVGAYYYYGQYILSLKSWQTGIWKDCHDRADIVNTSICQQYYNVSYDEIAARSIEPLEMPPISDRLEVVRQTSLPTEHCTTSFRSEDSLSRSIVTFIDLMIILGHFAPIGAAAFWFLVCLYHLTSIGHFPLRAVAELYAGIFSIHIAFRLAPQHDVYCRIIASLAHVIIGVPTVKEMLHFWTTSSQPSRDYGKTKESEFEKDRDVLRVSFFHKQIWLVSWTYVYVHGATHWKFQGSHNPSVLSILGTTSLALPIFFIIVALGQRYTLQTKGHIDYEAQREVRAEFPVPIEIFESMQAQGVDIGKSKMA